MIIISDLYKRTAEQFREAGIPEPEADAFWIMREVFGTTRNDLIMKGALETTEEKKKQFEECVDKRIRRIPLQYIFGYQDFCGFRFFTDRSTLIPRYDTEVLVEEVLKEINCGDRVLDLCTGSGCILLSILGLSYDTTGVGADISDGAIELANTNISQVPGTEGRCEFLVSDLFENISGDKFQIIVSNPPYVTEEEYSELFPEVREHEPKTALVAEENGLLFYRLIAEQAGNYLERGGRLFFEIGCNQGQAVSELLADNGFSDIEVIKDLAGLDRVVSARLPICI